MLDRLVQVLLNAEAVLRYMSQTLHQEARANEEELLAMYLDQDPCSNLAARNGVREELGGRRDIRQTLSRH
jgi:hypothetical protein